LKQRQRTRRLGEWLFNWLKFCHPQVVKFLEEIGFKEYTCVVVGNELANDIKNHRSHTATIRREITEH